MSSDELEFLRSRVAELEHRLENQPAATSSENEVTNPLLELADAALTHGDGQGTSRDDGGSVTVVHGPRATVVDSAADPATDFVPAGQLTSHSENTEDHGYTETGQLPQPTARSKVHFDEFFSANDTEADSESEVVCLQAQMRRSCRKPMSRRVDKSSSSDRPDVHIRGRESRFSDWSDPRYGQGDRQSEWGAQEERWLQLPRVRDPEDRSAGPRSDLTSGSSPQDRNVRDGRSDWDARVQQPLQSNPAIARFDCQAGLPDAMHGRTDLGHGVGAEPVWDARECRPRGPESTISDDRSVGHRVMRGQVVTSGRPPQDRNVRDGRSDWDVRVQQPLQSNSAVGMFDCQAGLPDAMHGRTDLGYGIGDTRFGWDARNGSRLRSPRTGVCGDRPAGPRAERGRASVTRDRSLQFSGGYQQSSCVGGVDQYRLRSGYDSAAGLSAPEHGLRDTSGDQFRYGGGTVHHIAGADRGIRPNTPANHSSVSYVCSGIDSAELESTGNQTHVQRNTGQASMNCSYPVEDMAPNNFQNCATRNAVNHTVDPSTSGPQSKTVLASVKLGSYNGNSCLETFLAKFRNISQYFEWNSADQLFHLRSSLEGAAGQVLWSTDEYSTVDQLIRLLRNRFGNENQAERFRAELRCRRRRRGESLQSLYQDICRLMTLAYPSPPSALSDIVGRDAFLDALGNSGLRIRILEKEPKTLDEALTIACKLEAYDRSENDDHDQDAGKQKTKLARVVTTEEEGERKLQKQLSELQAALTACRKEMSSQRKEIEKLRSSGSTVAPTLVYSNGWSPEMANNSTGIPSSAWQQPVWGVTESGTRQAVPVGNPVSPPFAQQSEMATPNTGRESKRGPSVTRPCRICQDPTHWIRDCPRRRPSIVEEQPASRTQINTLSSRRAADVYLHANVYGKRGHCLLDTGCETSVIGRRMIPDLDLQPTTQRLYAANGTEIPLLGQVKISFRLQGLPVEAQVVVTEVLEDMILGIDWMTENRCQWDFGRSLIKTHNTVLRLHSRPRKGLVRRIYAEQDAVVSAGHQVNLPVNVAWPNLYPSANDFAVSKHVVHKDIITASTLLDGQAWQSAVRVLNASGEDVLIQRGTLLGEAEEVEVCGQITENPTLTTDDSVEPWQDLDERSQHLRPVLDSLPDDLSFDEKRQAVELVCSNTDLFSESDFDLGRSHVVLHEIDTGNHRPFKQMLRRHPLSQLPVIDEHVDRMLAANVIEPATSPWASNVVLVRRSDNTYRFCVDYRALNSRTEPDSYPLPRIDSCLDALGGAKYFSTLDLRSGYWQVPMDPKSSEKTAFVTRKGMWKFKVMPFGLTNAPATFQRLMDATMAGLAWEVCLIYLDDIIIFAETFAKHVERLKLVFDRLRAANLKLKPEKCRLFQRQVQFLGSVVSGDGIRPDPSKVRAVAQWPVPRNLTEVRAFVALASYYRRHFADTARSLHELNTERKVISVE